MESQPQNPEFRINPENFHLCMPLDKSAYWKIIYLISHTKHMLWVLKRSV